MVTEKTLYYSVCFLTISGVSVALALGIGVLVVAVIAVAIYFVLRISPKRHKYSPLPEENTSPH